ncbi:gamma-glutamylcyclotransferase [Dokdonella sp.]|uniref:gamma-glutamylcyclotransferase n=1 Tax=Dokdonella sp. TaxID=2291710 RepID=UPI002BEEAC2A|nr:gamma-glutamylcyclotransferase [Dokdonella sp.]HPN79464.1 gamma-glutamylcyclotransferase [Dokdonella sp.]
MSHDTIIANQSLHRFDGHDRIWLFGYGSLIWKADFSYIERRAARIHGWSRRFWQGSHDHRGTPESPGRVVTLVAEAGASCAGMAYLITPEVFDHLDHREKNGYLRETLAIEFKAGGHELGLVYIANPANAAFLGDASDADIARHIANAKGPSGLNRDYFRHLADALRELGEHDPHIEHIGQELQKITRVD